jgi:biopolymer transport protein TolR
MGMAVGGGGSFGSGRGRRVRRRRPMSEINVTPFVDVMLVLLIIFMVSAPLLTVGVPLDLPKSAAKPLEGDIEPLTISIDAEGKIYLQETEIGLDTLIERLTAIAGEKGGTEERILLRGDASSNYGTIMRVMGRLNKSGFNKIALVTTEETS